MHRRVEMRISAPSLDDVDVRDDLDWAIRGWSQVWGTGLDVSWGTGYWDGESETRALLTHDWPESDLHTQEQQLDDLAVRLATWVHDAVLVHVTSYSVDFREMNLGRVLDGSAG